jgi:hypothetical protein
MALWNICGQLFIRKSENKTQTLYLKQQAIFKWTNYFKIKNKNACCQQNFICYLKQIYWSISYLKHLKPGTKNKADLLEERIDWPPPTVCINASTNDINRAPAAPYMGTNEASTLCMESRGLMICWHWDVVRNTWASSYFAWLSSLNSEFRLSSIMVLHIVWFLWWYVWVFPQHAGSPQLAPSVHCVLLLTTPACTPKH